MLFGGGQSLKPSNNKRFGFTLAEVLITLGIIGVVAAITMPVLLSNVQDRVKQKRVENIKQKLSKVTDKMAVQSGLTGYGDTMSFVQEMSKHMKIAKICDNNHIGDCWPTKEVDLDKDGKMWEISKTKSAKTLLIPKKIRPNWADTVGIVTADGTSMILSYDKTCDFDVDKTGLIFDKGSAMSNSMGCLSGVFDWNGGRKPNKLGDDVTLLGVAKGLGTSCALEVGGICFGTAFTPIPLTSAQCEKEKDSLGIKECCADCDDKGGDYWAGAVKQCGGVSNMPTLAQLMLLDADWYGKDQNMDISKVRPLGFIESYFSIWTNESSRSNAALRRDYGKMHSWVTNLIVFRHDNFASGVCIGD